MTERPILFSSPMVRALLDARKTQTRRIVKPQPSDYRPETIPPQRLRGEPPKHDRPYFDAYNGGPHWCWWDEYNRQGRDWIRCPYGVPGDTLWVKETWHPRAARSDWDLDVRYAADGEIRTIKDGEFGERDWTMPKAAATGNVSPLFMPRWASRLSLTITDVRCERLQDISRCDAIAEGATARAEAGRGLREDGWSMDWSRIGQPGSDGRPLEPRDISLGDPQSAFANFINELHGGPRWNHYYNGDRSYPEPIFDANPWVWVVTFEVQARP